MGNVRQMRKRRRNLLAEDPHCHWCGRELRDYDVPQPQAWPADMATLDHLNSRILYPGGRPVTRVFTAGRGVVTCRPASATVLSCFPCNQKRAVDEEQGVEWTAGCRANPVANGVAVTS